MRDLSVYLNADTATVADLRDAVIIFFNFYRSAEFCGFYPRDAVLARVLAMALCPSVIPCLSITSRSSI